MMRTRLIPRIVWGATAQSDHAGDWSGWYLRFEWLGLSIELQGARLDDRWRA